MFKTKIMQNVSVILGTVGCGSSKEMKELVTKGVPARAIGGCQHSLNDLEFDDDRRV
jgi:hypothetical protein